MKVNIYQTVEVSDADRKLIAAALGQKTVNREEIKEFVWTHGANWQDFVQGTQGGETPDEFKEYAAPVTDEDLIGGGDDDTEQSQEDEDDILGTSEADEDLI